MVDGIRGLAGLLAQLLVGEVSVTEQGLVPAHCQLMGAANARTTVQIPLRQKPATTTIVHFAPLYVRIATWLVPVCATAHPTDGVEVMIHMVLVLLILTVQGVETKLDNASPRTMSRFHLFDSLNW